MCLGLLAMPLDPGVEAWAAGLKKRNDFWVELDALQQYGQAGTSVIAAVLIWTLDPLRRRRLLDWAAAAAVVWVATFSIKTLVGRPRPRLDDPFGFLWPWGAWDFGGSTGVRHAWEVGRGISSDLWSMPSSHAAFAVVMSVFLTRLYPALRGFAVVMVLVVAAGRVLFRAHYLSDVLVGAGLAWALTAWAVGGYWGVQALDWVWKRAVDRRATPAWPAVVRADRRATEDGAGVPEP